jgi:hypothetical protein
MGLAGGGQETIPTQLQLAQAAAQTIPLHSSMALCPAAPAAPAWRHAALHAAPGRMPQLTDRFRQKAEVLGFELRVLRVFSHADLAAVAVETGVPLREVVRIAEAFVELLTAADANVAATGTNQGQAFKRVAAIISTLARELVRAAKVAGLTLPLEDAVVLVKGTMPAANAVADDVHLVSYFEAARREAGLSADAPIGALQSVMCAATGETRRDSHAARARTCAPLLATAAPATRNC